MRRVTGLSIFLALLCACAVMEAPSGGPEDKIPPSITGVTPASDSTGVAVDTRIVMEFSEKVDAESFKKKITIYPPVEYSKIESEENRLVITFSEEIPETTMCVVLKSGFRDEHLVENRENYGFYFSTRDRLEPGGISGKILFKQRPDSMGVVMAVELRGDTIRDLYTTKESRISFTDGFGNYLFRALPADSSKFLVWAFIDSDGDGRFSYGKEFAASRPDTILLTLSNEIVKGIDINVIDPNEPAKIRGIVFNRTGSSVNPVVRFDNIDPAEKDVFAAADTTGAFMAGKVKPGRYIFHAFIDIRPDSLPGEYTDAADSAMILEEPSWMMADTLSVGPGAEIILEEVVIGKE